MGSVGCISAPYLPSQSTSVTSHTASRKGSPTDPVPEQRHNARGSFIVHDYKRWAWFVAKKAAPTQQVYLTPPDIKGRYADWFDPCPHPRSEWDGLQVSWGERAFCNPPWCDIRPWVQKALEERDKGCVVHMLLPPATSTATWHDLIFPQATQVLFLRIYTPYLRVSDGKTVAMPSCIVTFDGQVGAA